MSAPPNSSSQSIASAAPEESSHRPKLFFFIGVVMTILVGIATQKWGTEVPDPIVIGAFILIFLFWLWWGWTHPWVRGHCGLVYTYPRMSFALMIIIGGLVGSGAGALLWWSLYKQPAPTDPPGARTGASNETQSAGTGEETKTTVTGVLLPGSESLPTNCGTLKPGEMAVLLGNTSAITMAHAVTILRVGGESILSFERISSGISLNAVIRNEKNEQVVTIIGNVFRVKQDSGYEAVNPDESTLAVFTPDNRKALYIKYLNPSAVRVLGIFYSAGIGPITIDSERFHGPGLLSGPPGTGGPCLRLNGENITLFDFR